MLANMETLVMDLEAVLKKPGYVNKHFYFQYCKSKRWKHMGPGRPMGNQHSLVGKIRPDKEVITRSKSETLE